MLVFNRFTSEGIFRKNISVRNKILNNIIHRSRLDWNAIIFHTAGTQGGRRGYDDAGPIMTLGAKSHISNVVKAHIERDGAMSLFGFRNENFAVLTERKEERIKKNNTLLKK